PDYRLLGMEPDTPRRGGDWDTGGPARDGADWGTPGPSPSAPGTAGEPGSDWPAWAPPEDRGPDLGDTDWRPVGPDAATGAWSPAEPVGREPDYPALFGELNRRKAAQREALWDSEPAPEPAEQ